LKHLSSIVKIKSNEIIIVTASEIIKKVLKCNTLYFTFGKSYIKKRYNII